MAHRPAQPADGAIPGYLKGKKTFGIVLNPEKWDIMCSFPRDGQTDYRRCSGPLELKTTRQLRGRLLAYL